MGSVATKRKLSQDSLNYIQFKTKLDQKTILDAYDDFMILNPSGKMSRRKLLSMYHDFFPNKNCHQLCAHIFRILDLDQNGYVDFVEFIVTINLLICGSTEDKIKVILKFCLRLLREGLKK